MIIKKFNNQIDLYRDYHKNKLNRILHILSLFEIQFSVRLYKEKKYFKSILFYIFFNHSLMWLIGHIILEKNGRNVKDHFISGFRNINLESILFFSLYTPILRVIDFFTLIFHIKSSK